MVDIDIKDSPIPASPVQPVQYNGDQEIQFRCHKDIECFNACCKRIDLQLTPYDIVRLKNHLGMQSGDFLKQYTFPYEMDKDGVPGVKMMPVEGTTQCQFMTDEGCSVYEARPASCRYYPAGLMSLRRQDENVDRQSYIIVQEDHCKGHFEDQVQTIDEYRKDQGVEEYDENSRGWRQLVLKKMSSGPVLGKPTEESLQLLFMASYNHDKFREFINSPSFQKTFDLNEEVMADLNSDDVILMHFGIDFLKQVLFGEMSIPLREGAAEARIAERKDKIAERNKLKEEVAKAQKDAYELDQERDEALGDNLGCTDGECNSEG
jgi:Fe-S-cluster containining protein